MLILSIYVGMVSFVAGLFYGTRVSRQVHQDAAEKLLQQQRGCGSTVVRETNNNSF